jgi:predicted nucleic acid-binding protein
MKVLVDTNIILNKLLKQPAFFDGSNAIFKLAEVRQITGYISASAITDIYYIARDTQDFSSGTFDAVTPEQFLRIITGIE